jgi:hypothetical protein
VPDLSDIRTPADLAGRLDALRRELGLSYAELTRRAADAGTTKRSGEPHGTLSRSTLSDMLRRHIITEEKLRLFLAACQTGPSDMGEWVDAWRRVTSDTAQGSTRRFFDHLVQSHTQLFAGRGRETDLILDLVRERGTGYVFVEALSGYGKTSLLAHLVDHHSDFAYHFISQGYRRLGGGFDPTDPSDILENLCEQLNPAHVAGKGLKLLEEEFRDLLTKPRRSPAVVVLDAIDELMPPRTQLQTLLPLSLPTGLVVVLSARKRGDGTYLPDVGLSEAAMDLHLTLPGLDAEALVKLLGQRGARAAALSRDDGFVADLHAVSQGDPFYLRFLVEDVAAGRVTADNVDRMPVGLGGYLDQQFGLLTRSMHRSQHVGILGLLLNTRALSATDLIAMVDDLTWANFGEIIGEIERFLLVHDGQFTFCHDRFREYFKDKAGL